MCRSINWIRGATYLAVLSSLSCLIPDRDIVIRNKCGREWVASTAGAYGYSGSGDKEFIRTDTNAWVSHDHCLSPKNSDDLDDVTSDLAGDILSNIALECEARAAELNLMDIDSTCVLTANYAYIGPCYIPGGCSDGDTGTPNTESESESGSGSESSL